MQQKAKMKFNIYATATDKKCKPCRETGISSGDSRHTSGCPNKFGQCFK